MVNLISACPVSNPTLTTPMLKILYTILPGDDEVHEFPCEDGRLARKAAYQYLLEQGYEIVGEA